MLHLALISFNEVFKQLLISNGNFKVVHFFLVTLRHVALIDMLSDSYICCKRVIWPPEDIHSIADRRAKQLRVMLRCEIFAASMVANGLQPRSIRLQLMYQFSSLHLVSKKTILEVEYMTMCELHKSMTSRIYNI